MTTDTTTERCGACHNDFSTLAEVFSHDCDAMNARRRFRTVSNGFGGTTTVRYAEGEQMGRGYSYNGGGGGALTMATTKQLNYIRSLGGEADENLTRAAASELIDSLVAAKVPAAPADAPAIRRNRFAGSCGTCRGNVAEGEGCIVNDNGRWVVYHLDGGCPTVTTTPVTTGTPIVPAGRYAVENADGILRFYKIDVPTEGRWLGRTFVKVMASDDTYPVRGDAARLVLEAIAVDSQAAMLRFGHSIGACGHCGRTLTDEDSRARGIGPVCAGKLGW